MKKTIVITTVSPKTDAIRRFECFPDWQVILVGDRKTPPYERSSDSTYLSLAEQRKSHFSLGQILPVDHYARKNLGYLHAISLGSEAIYDTDDDNLPYPDWAFDDFTCAVRMDSEALFVNAYRHFTDKHIWPRGFPLNLVQPRKAPVSVSNTQSKPLAVWQGLADSDPDVDAVYRMIYGNLLRFERSPSVYIAEGKYCPFNSQNTLWQISAFPLLYLPATVSFRFTDILRSFVAQRIFREMGLHLGFCRATVYQRRNDHDLMRDFSQEVECFQKTTPVVHCLERTALRGDPIEMLLSAYEALVANELIPSEEIGLVEAWQVDFRKACREPFNG
jgi:hypothetical protein